MNQLIQVGWLVLTSFPVRCHRQGIGSHQCLVEASIFATGVEKQREFEAKSGMNWEKQRIPSKCAAIGVAKAYIYIMMIMVR